MRHLLFLCFLLIPRMFIQGQTITANYQAVALPMVLNEIRDKHQVKFAFDYRLVEGVLVTASFREASVEEVLEVALSNSGLTYLRRDDVYMIIPLRQGTSEEKPVVAEVKKPMCRVTGVVRDKRTGENLPFASVYFRDSRMGTITNQDGFFSLPTLACDSLDVVVSYLGYSPVAMKVLATESPGVLTVMLDYHTEEIEAVTVELRQQVFELSQALEPGKIKFNPSRLTTAPSLSTLDIVAPIQLMPGIDGTSESSAGFSIRKSAVDKNLVLYDGFTIYQVDHFFGTISSLNANAIKDIQVYKGGYDARYGGRVGGIVEITGKSGNLYKPSFELGADLLSAHALLELPIVKEKASIIIAGRRSYSDQFKTDLYNDLFENTRYDIEQYNLNYPAAFKDNGVEPVMFFSDLTAKFTWQRAAGKVFSLSYHEGTDQLRFFQDSEFPLVQESSKWGGRGGSARWTGFFSPSWQYSLVTGISRTRVFYDHEDVNVHFREGRFFKQRDTVERYFYLDNSITDFSFSFDNQIQLSEKSKIEAGVGLNRFASTYFEESAISLNRGTISDTLRYHDQDSWLLAPYLQYVYRSGKWQARVGGRSNFYRTTGKAYPEIRVSGGYQLTGAIQLKTSHGKYHQFTNRVYSYTNGDFRYAWMVSDNEQFPVVSSWFNMVGATFTVSPSLEVDLEAYRKNTLDQTMVQVNYRRSGNNLVPISRFVQADNLVMGMDVLARLSLRKYQAWVAYTLSRSFMESGEINRGEPYPAIDDQLHELKLFNALKWNSWEFTLAWILGSGKRWDELLLTSDYKLSPDYDRNSKVLPPYHRLDGGLNYSFHMWGVDTRAGLSFFNLYNRDNTKQQLTRLSDHPLRDILTGQDPFYTSDVLGLGRAVNFHFRLRF